jgi:3-hydroxyisobutyrate dehydrogenase
MITIGMVGTGLMGQPMALRLLENGLSVMAYNRTASALEPLKQAGAAIASSPTEVLQHCEVTILMLSDAPAIRETILNDATRPALAHRTVIQMGTIGPSQSRELLQEITQAGGEYLEAPVLGSIPEVNSGNLLVMVGSTPEQFQQWRSLLSNFGPDPLHVGLVGSAAALKLALNQLIASLTTAFATSLSFVQQQGVEVDTFMELLRQSALYAPTFDKKLGRMEGNDYTKPNFPTKHLLKDTRLFLDEAAAQGIAVDSLDGIRQILEKACQMGLADGDYSALFAAIKPDPDLS